MPRINFVSFTFLFAFGLGSFSGIGLALLAVALARPADETTIIEPTVVAVVETPTATPTATPVPTATPTPIPVIRTLSTLQVRIGPSDSYAILGTLNSGSELEVEGRDAGADWVAIEFPPGSSALGWIPVDEVEGLSFLQAFRLDVLGATQIDTSPAFATNTPTAFEGNDGFPTQTAGEGTSTPDAGFGTPSTSSPFATPTPRALSYGAADLLIGGVTVASDGTLLIVVRNLGPGDVPGVSVSVDAVGLATEVLRSGVLRTGDSTVLQTRTVVLTESTGVSVTVDPNGELTDVNRTNNFRFTTLAP